MPQLSHATDRVMPPAALVPAAAPTPIAATITIKLPNGLPGFPGETAYALESVAATADRFFRLRAVGGDGPGFLLAADHVPLVDRDEVARAAEACGLKADRIVILLVVAATRDDGRMRLFVNRRAPLLVDVERGVAAQVVLARPDYAVRHYLGSFADAA